MGSSMEGPGWSLNKVHCFRQNLTRCCKATIPQLKKKKKGYWCQALGDPGSPVTGCVSHGKFLTYLAFAGPFEKYQEHNTKKCEEIQNTPTSVLSPDS